MARWKSRPRRVALIAAIATAIALAIPAAVWAIGLPTGNATADPKFEVDGDLFSGTSDGVLDWAQGSSDTGVISATRAANGHCTQTGSFTLGSPGVAGTGALVC